MSTIAIIGAGAGLGFALAKRFGSEGFNVALIARNQGKLDSMVASLAEQGITAGAFIADTANQEQLGAAIEAARARFGSIEVLEFSPYTAGPESMMSPLQVTTERLRPVMESHLFGAVTAIGQVLPAMREAGTGTILLTAGVGSIQPVPFFGGLNTAQAAVRNLALNLRNELAGTDVYLAHVAIGVGIGESAPAPGYPFKTPAEIADLYWGLFQERTEAELVIAQQD